MHSLGVFVVFLILAYIGSGFNYLKVMVAKGPLFCGGCFGTDKRRLC